MKCLTCKHCLIDFGSQCYSEMTPGSPGSWECSKEMWTLPCYGDGKAELIQSFERGETCPYWETDGRETKPN